MLQPPQGIIKYKERVKCMRICRQYPRRKTGAGISATKTIVLEDVMKKELTVIKKSAAVGGLIEYSLVTDIYRNPEDVHAVYGVQVAITKNGSCISSETVRDISCVKKRVENFIFFLSENEVLPGTLFDVVSDMMEESGEIKSPKGEKKFKKVV